MPAHEVEQASVSPPVPFLCAGPREDGCRRRRRPQFTTWAGVMPRVPQARHSRPATVHQGPSALSAVRDPEPLTAGAGTVPLPVLVLGLDELGLDEVPDRSR